ENRVVPSASPTGLDSILHPLLPAASLTASTAASQAEHASDQGIGDQVTAKVQELQDGRTPEGSQGIGTDLSAFVQTIGPKPPDHDESDSTDDKGSDSSGDHGIGDQVSAKVQELQDARSSDGPQGIGKELSAFVHSILPKSTDNDESDSSDDK